MEWIWVWNFPFPFSLWKVLEATLGCHFPILLQVLIRLSDKCSAKLQSTYLTLSNNEHHGLEVKNSKSVPGSSPILPNPRDEPGCQSFIIWNKGGVGRGTWTVCWWLRSSAHLAPFTPQSIFPGEQPHIAGRATWQNFCKWLQPSLKVLGLPLGNYRWGSGENQRLPRILLPTYFGLTLLGPEHIQEVLQSPLYRC